MPTQHQAAHKNKTNFDQPHKNRVKFDAHAEPSKSLSARTQISPQFRSLHKTKSISIHALKPHIFRGTHQNNVNFLPPAETKAIDMHMLTPKSFLGRTPKKIQFRSPHYNQVVFDPYIKPSEFGCQHWNQVNCDRPRETRSISMQTQNTIQFHQFHPHTTKETIDPHTKKKSIPSRTQKPSSSLFPHLNQVNFHPYTQ